MAFENLDPFRSEILALRAPGPHQKTLLEITDYLLEKHKLRTTPGTLSRYLKELRQPLGVALRDPTEPERERLEAIALLTEVLVEVRGRSDEQRAALEYLAGQVAIATRSVEELEKKVASGERATTAPAASLIRSIWLRAFVISATLCALISALILFAIKG
ncbi:MAG: hypothetical protein C0519_09630 [Hyphomicrobium sp.]|nr:hypothetical protein [Hyphomicrobium sp.]